MRLLLVLVMLTSGLCWAEDVRLLLSIGNNIGAPSDPPLEHAEHDAQRVAALFVDIGQVTPPHAQVLLGQDATLVREQLAEMIGRIKELTARGDAVSLLVFVSAHAKDGAFHLRGTHLAMAELREAVERSGARFKLVVVDACESGVIARQKGGVAAPEFTVKLDPTVVKGSVYVSSSGPAEASQEFASLQGSLFTHHWLTGLRGDADTDADGTVNLSEAYTYTFRRTVAGAAQLGQHPTFDIDASGAGDIVISRPGRARSAIVFPSEVEGTFVLVSQPRPDVVAEVQKLKGRTLRLAVSPGRYELRKRLGMEVGLISFDLPFGGERTLNEREMSRFHFAEIVGKGASFDQRPYAALLSFGVENEQPFGAGPRFTAGLGVRRNFENGWARVAVGLTGARTHAEGMTTREFQVNLRAAGGYRWLQWPLVPWVGGVVGTRVLNQMYLRDDEQKILRVFGVASLAPRVSFGLDVGAIAGVDVPLGDRFFASAEGELLLRWLPIENQSPFSPGLVARLALGFRW